MLGGSSTVEYHVYDNIAGGSGSPINYAVPVATTGLPDLDLLAARPTPEPGASASGRSTR